MFFKISHSKGYDILKSVCKKMFLMGYGNFWYENDNNSIGNDKNILYRIVSFLTFTTFGVMVSLEMMAALCGDFSGGEKADSVILSVSHTIIVIKFYLMILHKEKFKLLNEKMVKICEPYEDNEIQQKRLKVIKINVYGSAVAVYSAVFLFLMEGVQRVFRGSHYSTVITYYPSFDDNSLFANIIRIFFTLVLIHFVICMSGLDALTVTHLIMYKYKFITLRKYFNSLKNEVIEIKESGNPKLAAIKLSKGLVEGIVMHKEMLRLIRDLEDAFGVMIALQLFLCSGTIVAIMLQIALSDSISLVGVAKMILSISTLAMLLALNICNAGDLLYEASLLSDAIFYCGWYEIPTLPPPHINHSKLVLVALIQAQQPVIMKSFKMIEITYATYLKVGRITYSIFAVFYAQNKKSK
ncbi:hypothetical protein ACJJTC_019570 [Scirpophaga incertulas]